MDYTDFGYANYTRINGAGPHLCEVCDTVEMAPGNCFDIGAAVSCLTCADDPASYYDGPTEAACQRSERQQMGIC